MFHRASLLGREWGCRGRTFPGRAFFLALLLPLFLPKTGDGQKPVVLRPDGGIEQLAFSPNSQILAVGCGNGAVYLWDLTAKKPPHVIRARECCLGFVGFVPDGERLVTVSAVKRGLLVQKWEVATGKPEGEREIEGWQGGGYLCLSHDCARVAVSTGKDAKTVLVFDVESGRKLLTLDLPDTVGAAAFSPDNRRLVAAFNTGKQAGKAIKVTATVRFTHLNDGKQEGEFPVPFLVQALAFSRDGKAVAAGGRGLKIWDWHHEAWLDESRLRPTGGEHLALSSDGRLVASDNRVWNLQTKKLLLEVKGGNGPLALSPDGKKLAIEVGRKLHVYDLPSVAAPKPNLPGRVKKEE